jgi:ABC-type transport system involved in cytochrome bd biosynthesis fused ATPase/permease subunit
MAIRMKFRMTKVLRFWVDVEHDRIKNHASEHTRTELIAQILRRFEKAGDAMRYLNTKGEIAWKASPGMLSRLADAEQEARDDELAEWS